MEIMENTDKAKALDQWYTKKEVAQQCVKMMAEMGFIDEYVDCIEPSAGEGVFVDALMEYVDENYIHAFDIDPKREDIVKNDWLEKRPKLSSRGVVIGNPPYGKKGKLAVEFINKSLEVTDVVGFVVPITLASSWTAQKNIRTDAELILQESLPKNSFTFKGKDVDVPSVFQVWRLKFKDLRLEKPQTEHEDIEIRIYNKTNAAKKWLNWDWDIAVKRNSKKGEYILRGECASDDFHWILVKGDVELLKKIDWKRLNDNKMTAGIGKSDVVKAYMEVLNDNS
jgi:hypothetical protein